MSPADHTFRPLVVVVALACLPACHCGSEEKAAQAPGPADAARTDAPSDGGGGPDAPVDAATDADAGVIVDAYPPDAPLQPFRCIEDWPADSHAEPVPPLNVTPHELWRKTIPADNYVPNTALAGDHLGIVGGYRLWILDRDGNVTGEMPFGAWWWSPPVADPEGNFYVANWYVFSVRPDGSIRWKQPLGQSLHEGDTSTSQLLLSPDGILYFAATDGKLYAVRTDDGTLENIRTVGEPKQWVPYYLRAGVGNTLLASQYIFDRTSLELFLSPTSLTGRTSLTAASFSGLLSETAEMSSDGSLWEHSSHYLAPCGQTLWSLPNTTGSWDFRLVGFSNQLLVQHLEDWQWDAFLYSESGEVLAGPIAVDGPATALGADGTWYFTRLLQGELADQNMVLTARSGELEELWTMDFGPPATDSAVVIADDGVLYITRHVEQSWVIEIIAVQTTSPGLARTAVPTFQNNNRRTGWLE